MKKAFFSILALAVMAVMLTGSVGSNKVNAKAATKITPENITLSPKGESACGHTGCIGVYCTSHNTICRVGIMTVTCWSSACDSHYCCEYDCGCLGGASASNADNQQRLSKEEVEKLAEAVAFKINIEHLGGTLK